MKIFFILNKKISLFLLLLLIFQPFNFTLFAGTPERPEGFLGEVRISILEEKDFQSLYGDEWVPMLGQDISSSDLAKRFPKWRLLPDTRGTFIRTYGNQSEDVGILQNFATALPVQIPFSYSGQTTDAGNHQHQYARGTFQGRAHEQNQNWDIINSDLKQDKFIAKLHPNAQFPKTAAEGNHSHSYSGNLSGGDKETRPTNIAYYTYIKINETKNSKYQDFKEYIECGQCLKNAKEIILSSNDSKLTERDIQEAFSCFHNQDQTGSYDKYLKGEKNWSLTCVKANVGMMKSIFEKDIDAEFRVLDKFKNLRDQLINNYPEFNIIENTDF